MSILREREKAQSIWARSEHAFSKKTTFEKAFPSIESFRAEITETGDDVLSGDEPSIYSVDSVSEYIDCSNVLCYGGGFRLGQVLREMIPSDAAEDAGSARCIGHKGSPKGRRDYGPCINHFNYKITIKYKSPDK